MFPNSDNFFSSACIVLQKELRNQQKGCKLLEHFLVLYDAAIQTGEELKIHISNISRPWKLTENSSEDSVS